ncbi:hypothetical protein [Streptomyces sp. 604F]|uniref:hypothetical protein n=1 Tax=Streptomyces sp. 604F TaxID=1476754 RepID=UPI0013DCD51F|nr:hypothetical protein [Streptomyces sp. 604F]
MATQSPTLAGNYALQAHQTPEEEPALMRRTAAVLLAVATTMGGMTACSSSDDSGKPDTTATETVTATPSVSEAEAREACVEAWAQALLDDPDLDSADEPTECEGLPTGDRLDRYMEGLQKRNAINRGQAG